MSVHIRTTQDVQRLGTILGVWAHPDDETFSAAGIMLAALKNGQQVVCLTATKGEAGVQDAKRWPPEQLGEIRAHELQAAYQILGITKHHWLDYKDGSCHLVDDNEGAARIREFIDKYQPQTILTFGPDGLTGHNDHQAVSRWASLATRGTDITIYHLTEEEERYEKYMKHLDAEHNIYFNIDKPPVCSLDSCDVAFKLNREQCQKKCAALKAMPSQTEAMFKTMPDGFMEAALSCECYVKGN